MHDDIIRIEPIIARETPDKTYFGPTYNVIYWDDIIKILMDDRIYIVSAPVFLLPSILTLRINGTHEWNESLSSECKENVLVYIQSIIDMYNKFPSDDEELFCKKLKDAIMAGGDLVE